MIMRLSMLSPRVGGGGNPRGIDHQWCYESREFDNTDGSEGGEIW
jgi:hypothetical protein